MAKLLLHACCAVCASYPVLQLQQMGYEVILYFYNPNIYPYEEYQRRLDELKKLAVKYSVRLIIEETGYDYWLNLGKGMEKEPEKGARCSVCFKERLSKAVKMAIKEGCEYFTTTLTVSPHKNSKQVFEAAYSALKESGKEESLNLKHDKNIDKFEEITKKIAYTDKKKGKSRELFLSFINKNGYKSFYKENEYKDKVVLEGNFIENERLLNKICNYLESIGKDYIKFYSIFLPNFLEGIYLIKEDLLIVCENAYHENFINFKNKSIISKIVTKIAHNLDRAIVNHKNVEKFYVSNMNFDGLNKKEKEIISEIENKIK